MKFCPYCGATLANTEAAFCSECGQALKENPISSPSAQNVEGKSRKKKKTNSPTHTEPEKKTDDPEVPPSDDGYDGYYDDILPEDTGQRPEGVDGELIKKIIALSVGALAVITACVFLMYLI